jgi:signal transduction histidine kinase/ligand-binding sensor domain-containing protein
LDPNRVKSQYSHETWGSDKGLSGAVRGIAQTSDGYLWIGTETGLFRFDGLSFRSITDQVRAPASIVNVMGLGVDADGNLIVRLPERNLLRYRDGKFENTLDRLMPRELAVTAMCRGKDGDIFIAGLFNGVLRYRNGTFETIAPITSLAPSPIMSMTQSADGKIWLGTQDAALFYIDGTRLVAVKGSFPSRRINSLLAAGTTVWIGTSAGVVQWSGTAITTDGVPASLRHAQVLAMLGDRHSNLWVGTSSGLVRVHAGGSYLLDSPDRGFAAPVNALFEDQEGNLWAGGPWGIERWRDGSLTTYGRPEGLPSDHNGPLFADLEGRTWFAPLEGGLYWLSGGQSARVAQAGLTTDVVYSITGNNHDLWVGRQRGGLTHLRDQGRGFKVETFTQADGLAQDSVYSVYESHGGAIWAGTLNRGVSRYYDGRFTTYSTADGLASNTVSAILESSNGTMWFATPNGLTALSDHRWRVYTAKDGLPSDDVNCMLEDAGGVLWIGTASGLAWLGSRGVERPRNAPVTLHNPVLGLAQDKSGSLWIATPDHIFRLDRDKVLQGVLTDQGVREYVTGDGLRSVAGIRRDRSVISDPQGRIWFSTGGGLSVVDPSQLGGSSVPVFLHIEAVTADNSVIDVHGPVRIPPATRRLTFSYSGGSLGDPTRMRFRYQLVPYDPGWSAPTAAREAAYTKIGPGSYRFHVSASNNSGVSNEAGAFLDLSVAPAYYQTTWFRLSLMAAFLALLAALYQLRLQYLKRQFNIRLEERVNERTRIARDLHDTLLQSFQGVLMKLHAVTYRIPDTLEAKKTLESIIGQARQAVVEGRDTVYGLRSSTVTTNDLARSINSLGEELAAGATGRNSAAFQVRVEGKTRDLHPIVRDEVNRIAWEAVRNAFQHAEARLIETEIRYDDRQFRLRVRDDGKGMDPKVVEEGGRVGHFGVQGMRERAKLVGAKLVIWSELDSGTEVELTIPASVAYAKSPAAVTAQKAPGTN